MTAEVDHYSYERQTVPGAYTKIENHEEICALRYDGINKAIGEMKTAMERQSALLIKVAFIVAGLALTIMGWMAVQLWNGHGGQGTPQYQPATQYQVRR